MGNKYQILYNEELAQHYIHDILPELKKEEWFYVSLFSRKKYAPDMVQSSDRAQLGRFIVNKKDHIIPKIKRMEIPLGQYELSGKEVPQKSLALYIDPNPRCMKKAARILGKKCWDLTDGGGFNVVREALSAVQKSRGTAKFLVMDLDGSTKHDVLGKLRKAMRGIPNSNGKLRFIETKNGYHVLMDIEQIDKQIRGMFIERLRWFGVVDKIGKTMNPLPGTLQGNFKTKIISL